MIYDLQGPFPYSEKHIATWDPNLIGVYFCGFVHRGDGMLCSHYIGVATGEGGLRERLLCHLREDYWPDVTSVMVKVCSSATEACNLEAIEIARLKPKYNKLGK